MTSNLSAFNTKPFTALNRNEKVLIIQIVKKGFLAFEVNSEEVDPAIKAAYKTLDDNQTQSTLEDPLLEDVLQAVENATRVLMELKEDDSTPIEPSKLKSLSEQLTQSTLELLKSKHEIDKAHEGFFKEIKHVRKYKSFKANIIVLNGFLKTGAKAILIGGVAVAGVGLFYLRSHKLLALAAGCSSLVLFFLRSICLKVEASFNQELRIIDELTHQNLAQFSEETNNVYGELKKASWLMNRYLSTQQPLTPKDHWGLELLQEQLAAAKYLKQFRDGLAFPDDLKNETSQNFSLFFEKFEALCQRGKQMTMRVGVLALAWSCYVYMQRAYLMTAIGIVHFAAYAALTYELMILQSGSRKIKNVRQIEPEFQKMASHSFLLSRMGLQQANIQAIEKAVVIPFDAILKLIPSWKTVS